MTQPLQPNLPLACPMPGDTDGICGEGLHVMWASSQPLYLLDVTMPAPIESGSPWVQSWTVECEAGHVVMVPADPGCKHPDEVADDPEHLCDVDADEADRTFRAGDAARLAVILARLNAGNLAGGEPTLIVTEQP